jgi:hypothetical protein
MSPSRRGSSRRTTRWVTFDQAPNALVNGTAEQATIIGAAAAVVGSTILRIVGNIAFHGTTVDTATEYASGLIVTPSTMDTVDQDPAVNVDLDWMYWQQRGTNQAAYDGVDSYVLDRHPVDVRGRRRIDEGESLFYCETMTGAGGNSYVNLRVLLLNP